MAPRIQRVSPCFWFDGRAEQAVAFYTSIFPNSKAGATARYDSDGAKVSGQPEGSVMTIAFTLDGQDFLALNGGPQFKFNEAVSLMINCETQKEVDHYWTRLNEGGDERAQQCGWLKDRFGVSWQVVPTILQKLMTDPDPAKSHKVMQAMLKMQKLDIEALKKAADA